jgi:hypothetical protein
MFINTTFIMKEHNYTTDFNFETQLIKRKEDILSKYRNFEIAKC